MRIIETRNDGTFLDTAQRCIEQVRNELTTDGVRAHYVVRAWTMPAFDGYVPKVFLPSTSTAGLEDAVAQMLVDNGWRAGLVVRMGLGGTINLADLAKE